jgi:hypothetical protein
MMKAALKMKRVEPIDGLSLIRHRNKSCKRSPKELIDAIESATAEARIKAD